MVRSVGAPNESHLTWCSRAASALESFSMSPLFLIKPYSVSDAFCSSDRMILSRIQSVVVGSELCISLFIYRQVVKAYYDVCNSN